MKMPFLTLLLIQLSAPLCWARPPEQLSDQRLCPVEGGLEPDNMEARIQWFLKRHPQERVYASLFQSLGPGYEEHRGGRSWSQASPS